MSGPTSLYVAMDTSGTWDTCNRHVARREISSLRIALNTSSVAVVLDVRPLGHVWDRWEGGARYKAYRAQLW